MNPARRTTPLFFDIELQGAAGGVFLADEAASTISLTGLGNVVFARAGSAAKQEIFGGQGLSSLVLKDEGAVVRLAGALNTVVAGDGDDVVDLGRGRARVRIGPDFVKVDYATYLHAAFSAPNLLLGAMSHSSRNVGWFNGGSGNFGAFNGLGNASATSGNFNIGAFNGFGNGGDYDGNGNIGAFNGAMNGLRRSSETDGNWNGNGNVGAFEGDFNGNFITGLDSGNDNGNGNVGLLNGDFGGNGAVPAAQATRPGGWELFGGFDTAVLGDGDDEVTALAGVSTIRLGNGSDHVLLGGSFNTVEAGNGRDTVIGRDVNFSLVQLGDGGDIVRLTGQCNVVKTGAGADRIMITGSGNRIDAGGASSFDEIHATGGCNTFVLDPWSGYEKIFGFDARRGDRLDFSEFRSCRDAFHFTTAVSGCDTLVLATGNGAQPHVVAELMGVRTNWAALSRSFIF